MNARFFLAANAALVLITLAIAIVPLAGTLQPGNSRQSLVRGLVAIVSVAGFAALGLLYSARKGDLGWLSSFQDGTGAKAEDQQAPRQSELRAGHEPAFPTKGGA